MRKINELEVRLGKIDSLEESVQKLQERQTEGFRELNLTLRELRGIGSPGDGYREAPVISGLRSTTPGEGGVSGGVGGNGLWLGRLESFDTMGTLDGGNGGDGTKRNLQKHVSLDSARAGYETGRSVIKRTSVEENLRGQKRLTSDLWPITEENEAQSIIGSALENSSR